MEILWGELVGSFIIIIANLPNSIKAVRAAAIIQDAVRVVASFIFIRAFVALLIHYL